MLQFFSNISRRMNDRMQPNNPLHDEGEVDLLSHPALKAMSPRELADIPFPRTRPRRRQPPGVGRN